MVVFVVILLTGLGIVFGTKGYLDSYKGLIALYVGIFLVDIIFLIRSIYYLTMKISLIEVVNNPTV